MTFQLAARHRIAQHGARAHFMRRHDETEMAELLRIPVEGKLALLPPNAKRRGDRIVFATNLKYDRSAGLEMPPYRCLSRP